MKKPFPTWFHESCLLFQYIYLSAGIRGLQIKLAPEDVIQMVGAETADLVL